MLFCGYAFYQDMKSLVVVDASIAQEESGQ